MKLLSKTEIEKPEIVYNLHVKQNHNYIVNGAVVSNCHGAKAHIAQKILNEHGAHIPYKFGVTGTFPKPEADRMSLNSSIGDILIEIPARWLIDNGYLAEVDIEQYCLKQPHKEQFPDYAAERTYLSKNDERIQVIAGLIITHAEHYGNTLVLVNSVPFGEKLTEAVSGNAVFLYGASKKKERKEQYELFETQNDMIVVATSGIASTGISIDRVKCLILVDAGKSFIKAIQSIGRGTRLASDKKEVKVIDIFADLKWSKAHSRERAKWYKEAQYNISKTHNLKI